MSNAVRGHGSVPGINLLTSYWQGTLIAGLFTLAVGVVVAVYPSTSINLIAVSLGILLVVGGILELTSTRRPESSDRTLQIIVGIALIVVGVLFIRHLHITLTLIALLIGLTWIVQGISALLSAADSSQPARGWIALLGVIGVAAGIVVLSVPESSLKALAVLIGIWLILMGIVEIILAFALRSAVKGLSAREAVHA